MTLGRSESIQGRSVVLSKAGFERARRCWLSRQTLTSFVERPLRNHRSGNRGLEGRVSLEKRYLV